MMLCVILYVLWVVVCVVVVMLNVWWLCVCVIVCCGCVIGVIEDLLEVFKEEDLDNIVFVDFANEEAVILNKFGVGVMMVVLDWMI